MNQHVARIFGNDIATASGDAERVCACSASEWNIESGMLRHRTGRFFSIAGCKTGEGVVPIIRQAEVGLLGFVMNKNREFLVQAKYEPGNVCGVQLAPSCQATLSNSDRVHGGDETPCFSDVDWSSPICSTLQSEQGTLFTWKRNRNAIARVSDLKEEYHVTHKWVGFRGLKRLLSENFTVNSDARSVLVCSDWSDTLLFALPVDPYLANSIRCSNELPNFDCDNIAPAWRLVPVENVCSDDAEYLFFRVKAKHREVKEWCQPLVSHNRIEDVLLFMRSFDGVMKFLLVQSADPFLPSVLGLTPILSNDPICTKSVVNLLGDGDRVIWDCWHSEEGGRFYQDLAHYHIIETTREPADELFGDSRGWWWLTLAQLQRLALTDYMLTNEARSALSLVLAYL